MKKLYSKKLGGEAFALDAGTTGHSEKGRLYRTEPGGSYRGRGGGQNRAAGGKAGVCRL